MTTTSDLPVSTDFFTSRGATPEQAQSYVAQHETLMGRSPGGEVARAELNYEFNNLPPVAKAPPPAPVSNVVAAEALAEHENAQLSVHMDSLFAPPRTPSDYRMATIEGPGQDLAADVKIRDACFTAGLSAPLVQMASEDVASAARTRVQESEPQMRTRIAGTIQSLQRMWGTQYAENMATAMRFLNTTAERSPDLAPLATLLMEHASPFTWDRLLIEAQHHASRR